MRPALSWGVTLLAFWVPLELFLDMLYGVDTILKPYRAVQLGLLGYVLATQGPRALTQNPFYWPLAVTLGAGVTALVIQGIIGYLDVGLAANWILLLVLNMAMFLLLAEVPLRRQDVERVLIAFAAGVLLNGLHILTETSSLGISRGSGYFDNPNALGLAGSLMLVSVYRLAERRTAIVRLMLSVLGTGVAFWIVNATASRSALMLIVFIVILTTVTRFWTLVASLILVVVAMTMLNLGLESLSSVQAWQRQESKLERADDEIRIPLAKAGMDAFIETYGLGLGVGQFQNIDNFRVYVAPHSPALVTNREYKGSGLVTHMTWVQLIAEYGLVGATAFGWFIIMCLVEFARRRHIVHWVLLAQNRELVVIFGMLLYATTHVVLLNPMFWMFMGLLINRAFASDPSARV